MTSMQTCVNWQSTKKTALERNRHMLNNSEFSDISFTCQGSQKVFYAHKYVLATSSAVFNAILYGDSGEKISNIHLNDTDEKSLEEFLTFLYTDNCNLTPSTTVSVVYLSKKYNVPALTEYVKCRLARDMDPGNVLSVLDLAIHFEESDLEEKCWQVIEWRTCEVIASKNFNNVSRKTLASLLRRNHLMIPEVELFQAVLKWIDFQCSQKGFHPTIENRRWVIGEAIYDLRFLAMTQEEFAKHVSKSGLLSTEELVPVYEKLNNLESALLKWKLPEREKTLNATKERIRISRFSKHDYYSPSRDLSEYQLRKQRYLLDTLSFSVDQYALFLGVQLFGNSSRKSKEGDIRYTPFTLLINDKYIKNAAVIPIIEDDILYVDVFFEFPILIKKDEVVKMGLRDQTSQASEVSHLGWRGKPTVTVNGITATFFDVSFGERTCVSKGQFHQIIISV
ncbi:BTB/POZ domain-containing protein 6-B-like [Dendronephthya gigantea]|uniref:BTB/POZ domain-containing protein 6-B-like n=1 Tax=Dendronephthya gigantea TaxID=151771 RepID=UPI00106ADCE2|nr:BTB/POZ domain-containing protein 6-B-like [Dendronephthya gigantea]